MNKNLYGLPSEKKYCINKFIIDDYKLKLLKAPIITRDLIGPEYTAEQQLLDLSLDLQLQNYKEVFHQFNTKKSHYLLMLQEMIIHIIKMDTQHLTNLVIMLELLHL